MSLVEIKIEIQPSVADSTDTLLLEQGIENWSLLEDAIAKQAWIVGVFEGETSALAAWEQLRPSLPAAPLSPAVLRPLADEDWRDSYKAHFKPSCFGRLHWVPIWLKESYALPAGDAVIWLDPGLAFGTGNHETTRLCVERLVTLVGRGDAPALRVVDAGCGSGILALSAVRLGCRDVAGFDNDPEAIRVSQENAALNGLAGRVRFATADLVTGLVPAAADVLLANIQADVLMRFASPLLGAVAPGGTLAMSGILAIEIAQVRAHFVALAPTWPCESRTLGEWSDLALQSPPV